MDLERRRRQTLDELEMVVAAALTVVRRPGVRRRLRAALSECQALRELERAEALLTAKASNQGEKLTRPPRPL